MTHTVAKDLLVVLTMIPQDLDTSTPKCIQQIQIGCQLHRRFDPSRQRQ